MKINSINSVNQVYKTNSINKNIKNVGSQSKDSFDISQVGKDLLVAKNAIKGTPDIRFEKVDKIKEQINSGTYNVSSTEVANKIVENHIDKLL